MPPPYSQAITAAGRVFASATMPIDPRTGKIISRSVQEQVAQWLANISAILAEAGDSLKRAGFLLRSPTVDDDSLCQKID